MKCSVNPHLKQALRKIDRDKVVILTKTNSMSEADVKKSLRICPSPKGDSKLSLACDLLSFVRPPQREKATKALRASGGNNRKK